MGTTKTRKIRNAFESYERQVVDLDEVVVSRKHVINLIAAMDRNDPGPLFEMIRWSFRRCRPRGTNQKQVTPTLCNWISARNSVSGVWRSRGPLTNLKAGLGQNDHNSDMPSVNSWYAVRSCGQDARLLIATFGSGNRVIFEGDSGLFQGRLIGTSQIRQFSYCGLTAAEAITKARTLALGGRRALLGAAKKRL